MLQVGSRGIEAAWAGGSRGREVTDRFLPVVDQLLSTEGSFYLITIAENDPGEFTGALNRVAMLADILNVSFCPYRRNHRVPRPAGSARGVSVEQESWKREAVSPALPKELMPS